MAILDRDPARRSTGEGSKPPLLSLRALTLLLAAVLVGVLAVVHPGAALGVGTAVAALTLLDSIVGE